MKADRVVRDGKVAVLYSPGFGAGWSTWNSSDGEGNDGLENFLLFDPTLVHMVEDDRRDSIPEYVESVYPESYFYGGGAGKLSIYWVPEGVMFRVTDYDGFESLEFRDAEDWKIA
jgi:hypothetical protein